MATQFAGGVYVNTTFTGGTRAAIMSNIKTNLITAGWTNRAPTAGQGPGNVGTVTITIASPGVVTFTGHGFLGGEKILLSTTGALPTGFSVNTVYFVKFIDANTFNLATTLGGTNINTSGSQSGVHTLNSQNFQFQSATQANVTNPIWVNMVDNTANQVVIFGIQNTIGTLISGTDGANKGGVLLPAVGQIFLLVATRYWFLCKYTGVCTVGRTFVYAGMLYVPTNLTSTTDEGVMFSSAIAGNNTSRTSVFQDGLNLNVSGIPNSACIFNAGLIEMAGNTGSGQGQPEYVVSMIATSALRGYRWKNDQLNGFDLLLSHGVTSTAEEGKIAGQFFDLVCIAEAFTMEATDTFNSHTWVNQTNNATNWPKGGMWIATS